MTYFSIPQKWQIPEEAMRLSLEEMARDGAQGCEGVAMWLGHYYEKTAIVTHVAVLRGPGIRKAPDSLTIDADLVNDLTDVAIENKVSLIGQIHSHGPLHSTNLSETDKRYGITVPGYISAVAPDYALREGITIRECGVHVFIPGQRWSRLLPDEVAQRISISSGVPVSRLIAGGT